MNIDRAIRLLRAVQNPAVGVVEVCCAESCHGKVENVYPSPEDYALDEAINALEQLKEYQQLEEQDRLIKLPCKVGDKIYSIYRCFDDGVQELIVKGIHMHSYTPTKTILYIEFESDDQRCCGKLRAEELGRTLFLAKGEAEEKLKELRCNNDLL